MPGSSHDQLELGAVYVAGVNEESKHVQITAVKDKAPDTSMTEYDTYQMF
jgi:hypothetical protein